MATCCLVMSLAGASLGCVGMASSGALPAAQTPLSLVVDDQVEKALLEANGDRGRLLLLYDPPSPTGTTITIHGINASPSTLQPLHKRAVEAKRRVLTFLYDDQHRSLSESSRDLADAFVAQQHAIVGKLSIEAHSMGGRIALNALWLLGERARQLGDVDLQLIAPPLGGFEAANLAPYAPFFFSGVAGVRPGIDMGTRSAQQTILEHIRLSANVIPTIYVGADDDVIDVGDAHFRRVVERLGAQVHSLPRHDHDSVVQAVAYWPSATDAQGNATANAHRTRHVAQRRGTGRL